MAQSCDNYDTAYFRLVSVLEQALMTSVARRSFLPPREDFRRVKERFARGLALMSISISISISARPLSDLSSVHVAQGFIRSRGRRNTHAQALIRSACSQISLCHITRLKCYSCPTPPSTPSLFPPFNKIQSMETVLQQRRAILHDHILISPHSYQRLIKRFT